MDISKKFQDYLIVIGEDWEQIDDTDKAIAKAVKLFQTAHPGEKISCNLPEEYDIAALLWEDAYFNKSAIERVLEKNGRWTNYEILVVQISDGVFLRIGKEVPSNENCDCSDELSVTVVYPKTKTVTTYDDVPF